jgi:hypothetical protein
MYHIFIYIYFIKCSTNTVNNRNVSLISFKLMFGLMFSINAALPALLKLLIIYYFAERFDTLEASFTTHG